MSTPVSLKRREEADQMVIGALIVALRAPSHSMEAMAMRHVKALRKAYRFTVSEGLEQHSTAMEWINAGKRYGDWREERLPFIDK